MLLRQKLSFYLKDLDTPLGKAINLTIILLVLLSSILFVVDTYAIPASIHIKLRAVDNIILLVFALEYILRLWCAEHKVNYIFSFYSIIDLM